MAFPSEDFSALYGSLPTLREGTPLSDETENTSIEPTFSPDAGDALAKTALVVPEADSPRRAALPAKGIVLHALRDGFAAFLDLAKIIIPVYFAVALLNYSGLIALLAEWLRPAMRLFGLPGEAAIVLLTGWFMTLYAALGALRALDLPSSAITAIAFMLLFCHALPLEWAILKKMGARATRVTLMRFAISISPAESMPSFTAAR